MEKRFIPCLDQVTKNLVFPYFLLYMTERIIHAATIINICSYI